MDGGEVKVVGIGIYLVLGTREVYNNKHNHNNDNIHNDYIHNHSIHPQKVKIVVFQRSCETAGARAPRAAPLRPQSPATVL